MRHALKLLSGMAFGAGVLYFLDRENGQRRRAAFMQAAWPLPARITAGALGSALAWHGTGRKVMPGIPLTLLGFMFVGRALANRGLASEGGRETLMAVLRFRATP